MQKNERWPTRQSLNNGEKKNSSDNFVDSFELHLELGNMNKTSVVLIAFGLFAELASIADYSQKLANIQQKMNSLHAVTMVISRPVLSGRDARWWISSQKVSKLRIIKPWPFI